jgi:hypothetical protein
MKKDSHTEIKREVSKAAKAAVIAQKVAQEAYDVTKAVVDKAEKTAEKVLLFSQTIEYIQKDIAEIKDKLDDKYVTFEQFQPIKRIVYGLISLICLSVFSGLMLLLFKFK